ncbi:MAG: SDR family NAD(P)-dependent oxidoreductase, partial [Acetobacter fabarum]
MTRVAGKVAIVTGAANGIGKATAILLAKEGAKVVVADLQEEAGHNTVAEIKAAGGEALFVKLNVTQEADWQNAVNLAEQTFGKLDVAVNNAGIAYNGTVEST